MMTLIQPSEPANQESRRHAAIQNYFVLTGVREGGNPLMAAQKQHKWFEDGRGSSLALSTLRFPFSAVSATACLSNFWDR
jgi:hypothetical protein